MSVAGRSGRGARRAVLADLLPSALLVALTAALDGAVLGGQLGGHRTLAPGGAWPDAALALSLLSGLAVLGVPGAVRRGLVRRAGIGEIDDMEGDAFEARLAALYRSMGFAVRHTGKRGDFGADLLVERGTEREVVQAKRYRGPVGIEAVQQALGAVRYYDATGAAVVTNSRCTPAARALASANGVRLIERDDLVRLRAAHAEPGGWAARCRALVVQLAAGARLCLFVAAGVLRLAWWVVRAIGPASRGARRRPR